MSSLFRRNLDGHPLVADPVSLRAVLDAAPVCLFVTDPAGEIVHRNPAALLTAKEAMAAHGDQGLDQLRGVLKDVVRRTRKFPHHEVMQVDTMTVRVSIGQVPGGFVVSWRDETAQRALAGSASTLADDMTDDGAGLAGLGETLADSVGSASAHAEALSTGARELTESIREISSSTSAAVTSTREAVDSAQAAADSVEKLEAYSDAIGSVSQLITAIAEQTNLLALNATIEAARAGDAGRGFAVVASEVKSLASQTARATDEISNHISGMQDATQESVAAIKEIGTTIAQISDIASSIAGAVEQQGTATQEIARNVQHVAAGTQEAAANIVKVNRGATETGSASEEVLNSAKTLSGESARLRAELDRFMGNIRAA